MSESKERDTETKDTETKDTETRDTETRDTETRDTETSSVCMKQYYVYIMSNNSKTLYIGMTNDLKRRVYEHKNKLIEGFTKKYNITKLVYFEIMNDVKAAITREKQLKNWHRQWKINLIESMNKEWKDLSNQWYE